VSDIQPTRRDFLAGLVACVALCFAPWDRFCRYLRSLLDSVYSMTDRQVAITAGEFDALLKSIWPQQKVYELLYASNPMFGLVRKNA
jgi:hypothetical protein